MKKDYLGKSLLIITLATVGATVLYAWNGATDNPPNGNIGVPINSSILPQTKSGDLTLTGVSRLTAPSFCVGANCVTSLQSRVTGTCGSGSSIAAINADGTIARCQADNVGGGDNLGNHTASASLNMNNNWIINTNDTNVWDVLIYNGLYTQGYITNAFTSGGDTYNGTVSAQYLMAAPRYCLGSPTSYYNNSPNNSFPNCITSWSQAGGSPTGQVSFFNLSSCPSGWIPADGTSGTPDLRGYFIRGLGGIDPDVATRTLGSTQVDMLKDHTHKYTTYSSQQPQSGNSTSVWYGGAIADTGATTITADGGVTVLGKEVRPRNVALLACVKS